MKVVERMLEFEEYKQKLTAIKPDLDLLRGALKLDAAEREIEELEAASAREGFWNDVEKSQKVQKRLKTLQNKRDNYNRLCGSWDDLMTLCEMAIEEGDDSLLEELQADFAAFEEKVEETRLSTLLTGEYDGNNAILTFHAGAGGTEAQDWASMLYRMYNMWADRHGYKVRVMDYLDGDEAGLLPRRGRGGAQERHHHDRGRKRLRFSQERARHPPAGAGVALRRGGQAPHQLRGGGGHAGDQRRHRDRAAG